MENKFNSVEYISELANDLVKDFAIAGKATTPLLVGTAKENAVKSKLQKIFPPLIDISSGCVIDSEGNTSKQTDIIIYEKDFCPIFSINDTSEASYFPCESVVAVGEIKSTMNYTELLDSLEKIKSVKMSKRFFNSPSTRQYGSKTIMYQTPESGFNQSKNPLDQIYGFILCEKFGLSSESIIERLDKTINISDSFVLPNLILSLHDGVISYFDKDKNMILDSKHESSGLILFNYPESNFQFLLSRINFFIGFGRTTDTFPFEKYIINETFVGKKYYYKPFSK